MFCTDYSRNCPSVECMRILQIFRDCFCLRYIHVCFCLFVCLFVVVVLLRPTRDFSPLPVKGFKK